MSSQEIVSNAKKEFIQNMQKWVTSDTQLKLVNEKTKQLRQYRNTLSENICNYIQENNMENTRLEISDGEVKMVDKKEYAPITFGYIEETLGKIIKDKSQIDYIIKSLKDNRKITTHQELRKIVNSK
jgi:hypothetical protein